MEYYKLTTKLSIGFRLPETVVSTRVKDGNTQTYYLRYEDEELGGHNPKVWRKKPYDERGRSLQDLLDDRNLGRNNVFPIDLDQPEKNLEIDSDIAKNVYVELVQSGKEIAGSEYTVTEYKLNGDGTTRFSRVMLDKDRVKGMVIPNDAIANVRLYSSPINNSKVPIMLEFVGNTGGDSKWFHNQNKGTGTQWGEDAGSSEFYLKGSKDNSISTLTEKFTKKLDGLVCEYHNGVTIDLSHSISTSGGSYCCDQHKGKGGMVTVEAIEIKNESSSSHTTVYKHSVKAGQSVAGIKFYQDDNTSNRRKVSARSFKFPMEGPVDIYTFYSSNNPALIYIHGTGDKSVKGWFGRDGFGDNRPWKKTSHSLRRIKKTDIDQNELTCTKWTALRDILKERDVTNLSICNRPTDLQRSEESPSGGIGQEQADDEDEQSDPEESPQGLGVDSPPGPKGPNRNEGDAGGAALRGTDGAQVGTSPEPTTPGPGSPASIPTSQPAAPPSAAKAAKVTTGESVPTVPDGEAASSSAPETTPSDGGGANAQPLGLERTTIHPARGTNLDFTLSSSQPTNTQIILW
ncbi:hypothetical protein BEWA_037030 [Theileria equi strain WA]|uniref:Uncharacterized protein n=1 Tax=Theileria equi strain WA TaxID=1537102 RepID=L1LE03_THEEQ|nr:hypothetical protein BEWA_037030 [Theileria equi strain WA]EKX73667.1 hypothetical protein BEWA_037030 [Theileria equi strain WA]|eukprot:XP_004833119.1 hypothetical protein BEWA_037030 [Theileria equi strain WA]